MNAIRSLMTAMVLAVSLAASDAAKAETSILAYVGSSSFWVDVPAGWTSDPQTASKLKVAFVLTPAGTTFDSADALIIGSSYVDSSVAEAMDKVRTRTSSSDPAAEITALPTLDGGRTRISLLEIRSEASRSRPFETLAFMPLRNNVAVIALSAAAEQPHRAAREVLMNMLRTFAPAGTE